MSYLRDTAIILKNEPFREHDAWVTMYGKENGKMTAVARGARRSDAKSLGHLEPLSQIDVMIAKGAAFDKLAVARVTDPRPYLRERLHVLTLVGAFTNTVDLLTHPGSVDPEIYFLLQEMLNLADERSTIPSIARCQLMLSAAYVKLLDVLGYAPTLDQTEVSTTALPLLRFMRMRPLKDLLNITAPSQLFFQISSLVDDYLKQAPFRVEPHGRMTVAAMLG